MDKKWELPKAQEGGPASGRPTVNLDSLGFVCPSLLVRESLCQVRPIDQSVISTWYK